MNITSNQDTINLYSYLECIDKKFGKDTILRQGHTIRRKCNQKCIDVHNKKVKKEGKKWWLQTIILKQEETFIVYYRTLV